MFPSNSPDLWQFDFPNQRSAWGDINGFAPFVQSDFTFAPLTPPLVMEVNRAGNTVSTTNVTHIRSSSGGTALILEIGPDQSAAANDLFLFSGTSTFTLPGLTFDDLLPDRIPAHLNWDLSGP